MSKPIFTFVSLILLFITSASWGQTQTIYVPKKVIVQFGSDVSISGKNSTGLTGFDQVAAHYQVHRITRMYPFLDHLEPTEKTAKNLAALRRTYYVHYGARIKPERVARDLSGEPGVTYAEPVPIYRVHGIMSQEEPDDVMYEEQTYLRHLRLPEAWETVKGEDQSPPVVIAIVDGGSDWRHEDLIGNVWTNEDEIPGNGIDDDNNGFIDDVHGVNFANGDKTDNDPTGLPETPVNASHGTEVAGVASAVTDNGIGGAGAAWNAQLMHVNVSCSHSDLFCHAYEGVLYAAMNGADIINASWASFGLDSQVPQSVAQPLDMATDLGALVVASAGNDSNNSDESLVTPAGYFRVLSVGATEKDSRRKASLSRYGRTVNVFAPGVDILTTLPNNTYATSQGTSFASPLVAGVAALIKTRFPDIKPDALREQLRLSSENMDTENPHLEGQLGRGYVNAVASLQAPEIPGVRVQHWSWSDNDGNKQVEPGDEVTITATIVNYLSDAERLAVELVPTETYPFLSIAESKASVEYLGRNASTEIIFRFQVADDAPPNQIVRFYVRIQNREFTDADGTFTFGINSQVGIVYEVLRALYESTDGDNWKGNNGWDFTGVPTADGLTHWDRLFTLDRVLIGLNLYDNNLAGTIPPELGQLSTLTLFDLSINSLVGSIPRELGQLSHVKSFRLERNSLTGSIPQELGQLSKLEFLYLFDNSLTGIIPADLGNLSRLQHLYLSNNSLSGSIPPELGNLSQLSRLYLSNNSLSGSIPPEIGNLSNMEDMILRNNSLSGSIPSGLGNLSRLQNLSLDHNSLSNSIPPELGNLSRLQNLSLNKNSLTGKIPPELGNLSSMKHMSLANNSLSGSIPPELGNLSQLSRLYLGSNSLTGVIPPELGNLSNMEDILLGNNSLSGSIPPELGNLSQLSRLDISSNSLTGVIPPELGNLSNMEGLFLEGNSLSGEIPHQLGRLSQLEKLYLNQNSLSGMIPESLGQLMHLEELYLSDNSLTGRLPRSLLKLGNLNIFYFGGQDLCAPPDDEFQTWLQRIPEVDGPTCLPLMFAAAAEDQSYPNTQPISPLILPEVTAGKPPITYIVSPDLPSELGFDAETRTIHGTPTEVLPPTQFTYTATDADGATATLNFQIEIYSPIGAESETLPTEFAVHANYPNPFRTSTHVVFDLPWPSQVQIDVMDVLGRHVYSKPSMNLTAGSHEMELSGVALPSGTYLYRLTATSHQNWSVHVGRFVLVR